MRKILQKIAIGSTLTLLCVAALPSQAEARDRSHGARLEVRIGPDFHFGWFHHRAAERRQRRLMHERAHLLERAFEAVEHGELHEARHLFRRARMIHMHDRWDGWRHRFGHSRRHR